MAGSGCIINLAPTDDLSEKDWVAKVTKATKQSTTTKTTTSLEDIEMCIEFSTMTLYG